MMYIHITFIKIFHTTLLYTTELFKIFFSLLTLSTAFLQKAGGPGKNHYKIDARLLKFLTNYLQNRHQRTSLENVFSNYLPVKSGVPQGSILGPLLFVLFINDICSGINSGTNICLFADDTKIWKSMNSEADCTILQNDINYLDEWCKSNQMKFHPDKCKVVSIITKNSKDKLTYLSQLPLLLHLRQQSIRL